eukprot:8426137-Pyramimonas_sp.AAC.1
MYRVGLPNGCAEWICQLDFPKLVRGVGSHGTLRWRVDLALTSRTWTCHPNCEVRVGSAS